jgi:hypothetical protein
MLVDGAPRRQAERRGHGRRRPDVGAVAAGGDGAVVESDGAAAEMEC